MTTALPACPVGPDAGIATCTNHASLHSTCAREAAQLLADAWALGYHAEDAEVELVLSKGDWDIVRHHLEARAVEEAAVASVAVSAAAGASDDSCGGRWGEELAWQPAAGDSAAVRGSGHAMQGQQQHEEPGWGTAGRPSVEQAGRAGGPGDPTWPFDEQSGAAGGAKRGPRWAEQAPAAEVPHDDNGQMGMDEEQEEEELQQMLSMLCA